MKKNYTKTKTDRTWFSNLSRHPVRKRSGSILTTIQPWRPHGADFRIFHVKFTKNLCRQLVPVRRFKIYKTVACLSGQTENVHHCTMPSYFMFT